jgi:hypothetical protein
MPWLPKFAAVTRIILLVTEDARTPQLHDGTLVAPSGFFRQHHTLISSRVLFSALVTLES